MAQNYKEQVFERNENIAFVVGPQDVSKIPQILKEISKNSLLQKKIWETDGEARPEEVYHAGFYEDKKHTHVVISEGCSNFCSYCVVPYVRGPIRHRKHEDILKEIREAVENGISEITLLGQNANAYVSGSNKNIDFVNLLELVNDIEGLKGFDFMTSHPKDASVSLFKAIANLDKLKKALHLPVQSGSDRILKLMNRGYSKNPYLGLIKNYRKIVKKGAVSTDIIVGFPTESESDFMDTYNLVKEVGFNAAYIFKYSPRDKTQAFGMVDDVAEKEKMRRHGLILDLQRKISKKKHAKA
jgi:tRNA-2-methylthio-N6-dimethylallyladenosine synthase